MNKPLKQTLCAILLLVSLAFTKMVSAQAPPSIYTSLSPGNYAITDTIGGSVKWYRWTNDSAETSVYFKNMFRGSLYTFAKIELYALQSGSLTLINRDSLQTDSTIYLWNKNLVKPNYFYIKIYSNNSGCSTCEYPVFSTYKLELTNLATVYAASSTGCNIISNGDFTTHSGGCQIYANTGISGFPATNWFSPTSTGQSNNASPDYFLDCAPPAFGANNLPVNTNINFATNGLCTVGTNTVGAYAGLNVYTPGSPYREYLINNLAQPLQLNQPYHLSIWVRLSCYSKFGIKDLSMYFTNSPPIQPNTSGPFGVITPTAGAIVSFTASAVTDASGWTILTACFTPTTNYSLMTFGNFQQSVNTTTATLDPGNWTYNAGLNNHVARSYYYFDNVSIIPLNLKATGASTLCAGLPTQLNAELDCALTNSYVPTYSWAPSNGLSATNISNPLANPTVTTIYTVTAIIPNANGSTCSITQTVNVNVTTGVTPTLSISPTQTICQGTTATLTVSGALTYTWSNGSSSNPLVVNPSTSTGYTVIATGTGAGCTSTISTFVNVIPTPQVSLSTSNNAICAGSNATLTANYGVNSYTWFPANSGNPIIVTPTITTTYTVAGINSCGVLNYAYVTVSVSPTPGYSISTTNVCVGSAVAVTTNSLTFINLLNFDYPNPLTPPNAQSPHTYNTVGNYSLQVQATSGLCTTTNVFPITVTTPTTVVMTYSSLPCSYNYTFNLSSGCTGGGYTYFININGGLFNLSNTSGIFTIPFSTNGTYTIVATSDFDFIPVTYTITVPPVTPPSITLTASPSQTVCNGNIVTLTASGATTYTWSTGANTTTISVTPSVTTTYTVTGTLNGCIGTKTITINVVPNLTLTAVANPTAICAGASSTLTSTGATTYTWQPGAITSASTAVAPTVTTVYTVTGSNGTCSNTKTVSVTVNPKPSINLTPGTSNSICAGATAVINGNTSTGAVTYTWNPCTATCNTINHAFTPTVTTTYTLSGTSSAGCVNSNTFVVTVAPIPTVTVNSATICAGSSASLIATGANTYTWSTTQTTNSIVVNPSVTAVYTVTGKNNGCNSTSVKTATVTVIPASPISFFINTSSPSPIIANGTGTNVIGLTTTGITNTVGLNFNWSNAATTPTTNFNLTQPEIISLTITNAACNTSVTQSICVNYVAQACNNTTLTTLNNFTLTNNTQLVSYGSYFVTGTLTINWTTFANALENYNFLMSTNSKVEVTPTTNVQINNVKFFSCSGMWRGIELLATTTNAARVTLVGDNNRIEDAYMAFYNNNTAGLNVNPNINVRDGVTFNKNYYDIYLDGIKTGSGVYPINFSSNKLLSESYINTPGANLKCSGYYTPTVKSRSYAGVYAKNAGIVNLNTLGSTSVNTIAKNKDYGFYFDNTNANVNNINFSDAIGVAYNYSVTYNSLARGVGIYSKNSGYLNVKPLVPPTPFVASTTFTNIGYGIIANNTFTVDVQNANFNNAAQSYTADPAWGFKPEWGGSVNVAGYGFNGIVITNAKDVSRVNNNTFSANYYPVSVNYSVAPNTNMIMSVAQNTMTGTSGNNVAGIWEGISVNSALSFATLPDNMRIAVNTFTNVRIGIKATAVNSGLRISNNTINLNPVGTNRFGIYLNGANNGVVVDANNINGGNTGTNGSTYSFFNSGIMVVNSPGCKIKCNTITQIGNGIEFRGGNASPGDGFFGNNFVYPMRRGLVLSNAGLIGTQGNSTGASANQWTGAWPAVATADPNKTFVGGPITPSGASLSDAINSQLYLRSNSLELPSDNYFGPPSIIGNRYQLSVNMFTTTAGSSNTSSCPSALLQGLRTNGVTSVDNTDRDNDFVNYINNLVPATATVLTPQDKFMLKQYMFEALRQNPSTNSTITNFYNQQQTGSINAYYDIDSLLAAGNINLANTKNNQASQTNDITQTQNAYNNLYINGITSKSDMDNLIAIANLCPSYYGNAVFEARALLQTITFMGKQYNDSCENGNERKNFGYDDEKTSVSVTGGVQAKLYPNPNNGTFNLAYNLKQYITASIRITDITGKLVHVSEIDNLNNIIQLNTTNLQSGIYFIQLTNDSKLLWTDKLMISK